MKRFVLLAMVMMMLVPALALGQGAVLLMDMPEDAQLVENVEFDDGDFIQTYQLGGGANVHLLRYAAFGMTINDMIASEWAGAQNVTPMAIETVGSCPAQGAVLSCPQEGADAVDVTIILVDCGEGTLVFEAVVPQGSADTAVVQAMIDSLDVLAGETADGEAEVG